MILTGLLGLQKLRESPQICPKPFQQTLVLETNGEASVHQFCLPVTSLTVALVGLTVLLRLSTIVFALQLMEHLQTSFLLLTPLDAAMEPNASHTIAMAVKLQLHGDGLRTLVLSLVVLMDRALSVLTTLCQNAPITLFQTLLPLAIKSLKSRLYVQALAKRTKLLITRLTSITLLPTTVLAVTLLQSNRIFIPTVQFQLPLQFTKTSLLIAVVFIITRPVQA